MVAMAKPLFTALAAHLHDNDALAQAAADQAAYASHGTGSAHAAGDAALATGRAAAACALVYVPSRKQAQLTAIDLMAFAAAAGNSGAFLGRGVASEDLAAVVGEGGDVADSCLQSTLPKGVAFLHGGEFRRGANP
jgi:hypothetical protein